MKTGTIIYIVRDEITDMGSIATTDYKTAKKYARALVKNFRDELTTYKSYGPKLISEMKAEKIKLTGADYYSYWGRKAEVEEVKFINPEP